MARSRRIVGRRLFTRIKCLLGLVLGILAFRSLAPFPYASAVMAQAQAQKLDPYVIAAIIRVESSYRPDVVSPRGAVGLMQLMPQTASWIRSHPSWKPPTGVRSHNLSDPMENIALGTWYFDYLMTQYHQNEILALAAYNSGPAIVDGWIKRGLLHENARQFSLVPYQETRNFIARVLFYRQVYRILYGFPDVLASWKGG